MYQACLNTLRDILRADSRSLFIASDIGPGILPEIQRDLPGRYFMEGISEAHVIGMAAGLAQDGFIPFVSGISCFLTRRCYEQIALDICLHNLPVRIVGNGGGVHYSILGPTHMGVEDFALMNTLPNMTIVSPATSIEMKEILLQSRSVQGPLYIRVSKEPASSSFAEDASPRIGKGIVMRKAEAQSDVLLVSSGYMTHRCMQVNGSLEETGLKVDHLHFHTLAPFDHDLLREYSQGTNLIVTVEEHSVVGGLGAIVHQSLGESSLERRPPVHCIGLPKKFLSNYGTHEDQLTHAGLSCAEILSRIKARVIHPEK